ncbi:MAG: hypothetical protein IGS50_21750 [Synechococcales cyanobacterium C42_A2020_086]|jgi:hypothetical protein|nr:hypothetical protein [Synechococcales cyanobacterium C42_A2020_086]
MDNDSTPLINLLRAAIHGPPLERSRLLQQPETLRDIMNNVSARRWLFEQACQNDPTQAQPARELIVALMQSSKLIWRGGKISPDVYSEALSRTWVWFMENFQTYDPEKASFVTWFNRKLGWMIQDVIRPQPITKPLDGDDGIQPPPPELDRWHETIQEWLELVHNHPHLLRNCRLQRFPHLNCQVVLIQILTVLENTGEFSWETVAQVYNVEPSTLKRFCRIRCFPRFKQLLTE